jgi:hypothetical protein
MAGEIAVSSPPALRPTLFQTAQSRELKRNPILRNGEN